MEKKPSSYLSKEIFKAFTELEGGFSLLVKGDPGTGKTALALELLLLDGGIFVSTRVTPEALLSEFPWIREINSGVRFADATLSGLPDEDPRYPRLDYENIPEFLQLVFSILEEDEARTIVIDSWSALAMGLAPREQAHWESNLCRRVRKMGLTLVIITDGEQKSSLDWVVDGVISLSSTSQEEGGVFRRRRELRIDKLRGVLIDNSAFLSSLHEGKMHIFPPYVHRLPAILLEPEPISDPDKTHISSGNTHFDSLLDNGFLRGSYNLIEISHPVGNGIQMLSIPLIVNSLASGRGVISVLPEGASTESIREVTEVFVGKDRFVNQMVNFERSVPSGVTNAVALPEGEKQALSEIKNTQEQLRGKFGSPVIVSLGLDLLENKYGIIGLKEIIAEIVAHSTASGDVVIGWLRENQEFTGGTAVPQSHWKLSVINRALAIHGVIPQTAYFVIEPLFVRGYVDFKFIPVV